MRSRRSVRGLTLIEAVVALALLSGVMLSVAGGLTWALRLAARGRMDASAALALRARLEALRAEALAGGCAALATITTAPVGGIGVEHGPVGPPPAGVVLVAHRPGEARADTLRAMLEC